MIYSRVNKNGNPVEFTYSEEDKDLVARYTWILAGDYIVRWVDGKHQYLHRMLLDNPEGMVDHKNGNSLDNTRSNLRLATRQENLRNSKMSRANTSGVKGVSRHNGKWRARIGLEGKDVSLGQYMCKDEAIAARREAEEKYFGEFRRKSVDN